MTLIRTTLFKYYHYIAHQGGSTLTGQHYFKNTLSVRLRYASNVFVFDCKLKTMKMFQHVHCSTFSFVPSLRLTVVSGTHI